MRDVCISHQSDWIYYLSNWGGGGGELGELGELGEFSTVMQTLDFVSGLHNCLEFSQPLSCLYQAMQTQEKSFLLLL